MPVGLIGYITLPTMGLGPGTYTVAILAAGAVTIGLGLLVSAGRHLPLGRTGLVLGIAGAAMVAGARLLHWAMGLMLHTQEAPGLLAPHFNSFALYGGLIAACAAGVLACRWLRLDFWTLGDCLAPGVGLGIAIARVGCFLHGCCFGRPTDLPWGVRYPAGSLVHLHQAAEDPGLLFVGPLPVHPTQVYEMLAALVSAALAGWLLRRKAPPGAVCLSAAIAFTAFRCLNEPLRAHTSGSMPAHLLLYAAVIAAAVLARCRHRLAWPAPA